jgi:hypothetical protein
LVYLICSFFHTAPRNQRGGEELQNRDSRILLFTLQFSGGGGGIVPDDSSDGKSREN